MHQINKKIFPTAIRRVILLLAFLAFFLAPLQSLYAQEMEIRDFIVTNSSTDLLLFFTISNAFTPEIEEGIHNGIPVTFTFFVELSAIRKGWVDREEVSLSFDHSLAYDTLKEEYHITSSANSMQLYITKSLNEAKSLMAEVNGFRVYPLPRLVADAEYSLRVKARLAKKTLPLFFNYLVPFGSFWDFDTDWYETEFRY